MAFYSGPAGASFVRGDVNADGKVNISDAVSVLNSLFAGGGATPCAKTADVDDGGRIELTDAVFLLEHLFLGGMTPREPFTSCGFDVTEDSLDCAAFEPCS